MSWLTKFIEDNQKIREQREKNEKAQWPSKAWLKKHPEYKPATINSIIEQYGRQTSNQP